MDIQQQKQYKILVIGEECLDLYRYGKCERISPEAPVPILLEEKTEERPGMAANVSRNIQALGHETILISNQEKITKERIVHEQFGQQLLRIDKNDHCEALDLPFVKRILDLEKEFAATIISDYDKGFLSPVLIRELIPLLPGPIFVDSKKSDLSSYDGCILKINQFEHQNVTKFPKEYEIIVTRGEIGAEYMGKMFPVEKIEIKDICGAGDSFIAALAVRYLDTLNFPDAIKFANASASISVTHMGVYNPTLEEITNEFLKQDP